MIRNMKLLAALLLAGSAFQAGAQNWVKDSVNMGPGIRNEVFYSLSNGAVSTGAINVWELAHTQTTMDNCIRANHVAGVRVVPYPKGDTAAWSSFDTSGWKRWRMVFNDIHDHKKGAFNQQPGPGMWDFNWGVYNSSTHEVVGDSLHLLVLGEGTPGMTYKKFWPVKQDRLGNLKVRVANIDGTNDTTYTLVKANAAGKNYKYLNITTKQVVNREPSQSWDLLFTQYFAPTYDPRSGRVLPYPVMGVESNMGALSVAINGVHRDNINLSTYQMQVKDDLTGVGADWKRFDQSTFRYVYKDSLTYLVKAKDGEYWLLYFTGFGGSSTGKVYFSKQKTNLASVEFASMGLGWNVFPNPAVQSNTIFIGTDLNTGRMAGSIRMTDAMGREVYTQNITLNGLQQFAIPAQGMRAGLYTISLQAGNVVETRKLLIP
jgi:hypothetical protein